MHHNDVANRKLLPCLLSQRLHLFERHLFVGFVIQIKSAPAPRIVTNDAFKYKRCSVRGLLEFVERRLRVDSLAHDRSVTAALSIRITLYIRRASTHRRQKCNLVSFFQTRIRPGKLLIDGSRDRTRKLTESRIGFFVMQEDVAQSGMFGQVEQIAASAREIL